MVAISFFKTLIPPSPESNTTTGRCEFFISDHPFGLIIAREWDIIKYK